MLNLQVTVTRYQNSKVPGNKHKNTQNFKKIRQGVNIVKHLRKCLKGFNVCSENLLRKRLFECFNG